MTRLSLVGAVGLVALLAPAAAQAQFTGSLYSRQGVGERVGPFSDQAQALGGGYGLLSPGYQNLDNPALWSAHRDTRLGVTLGLGWLNTSGTNAGGTEQSAGRRLGGVGGAAFAFPVSAKFGATVGAFFEPYSRVGYDNSGRDDDAGLSVRAIGSGGLSDAGLGGSIRPFVTGPLRGVSVGLTGRYRFGTLTAREEVRADSAGYTQAFERRRQLGGTAFTIGLAYGSPGAVLGKNDRLSLGAAFTPATTVSGSRVLTYGTFRSIDDPSGITPGGPDTLSRGDLDEKLPARLVAGLTYRPNPRTLFTLDGSMEAWSTYSASLRDAGHYALGLEFQPSLTAPVLWRRTAYRLGLLLNRYPYQSVTGTAVDGVGLRTGFGIPVANGRTRLDLGVGVDWRGSVEQGLLKERTVRLTLGLNAGDLWFIKRAIE